MKTKNITLYIIICLIVIAGLAVWNAKGFNKELQYSSRKQIQLSNYTGIKTSEVENIAKEVLGNSRFFVQPVETFGNAASIVAEEMNEEQKTKIVEKFNEKYGTELKSDNVEIENIPLIRTKDILKPYIIPGLVTFALVIIYFTIRFIKLGWKNVLAKSVLAIIGSELILFSIIAVTRIPFGRITTAIAIGLYLIAIYGLTCLFESERERNIKELENQKP